MKLNLNSPTLKFSVSGLRGVYPDDINPENATAIIAAFEATIGKGGIAIARDNRPTGAALEDIVSGSLAALGRNVYKCGIIPTPTLKAFINKEKLAGGIMISASHNPIQYNAFKFIKKQGYFFEKTENDKFIAALKKGSSWGSYQKQGSLYQSKETSSALHIESILSNMPKVQSPKKIKVAIDTLGACATDIVPMFLDKMNIPWVSLFPKILPGFPRGPEPVPSALKKLGKFVTENRCDIGFAFDPDADRLALVNANGQPLGEELTLPLAMSQALLTQKGNVVVNLSTSYYNNIVAESLGSKVIRSEVGEANVVSTMIKSKAIFGGEGNGGVIDPQIPSFGRDSLSGIAWILQILRSGLSIDNIISNWPRLHMKKMAVPGDKKMYKLYAQKLKKELKGWHLDVRDGFHFSAPGGLPWIHLRPSNTEPVIRIIAESDKPTDIQKLFSFFK
ncbi:MAG: phosphoglucosamine mutase [Leptospirales bacterium]